MKKIIWVVILAVYVFVGYKAFTQKPSGGEHADDAHAEGREVAEHASEDGSAAE